MTNQVVVDAGVFLANLLPDETLNLQANQLQARWHSQQIQLHAPTLFSYEVVAVIRKAIFQKRLSTSKGHGLLQIAFRYPITLHFSSQLLQEGFEIAEQYHLPTAYDSQYIALAKQLNCDLWTSDKRLYQTLSLSWVRWLGDFTPL